MKPLAEELPEIVDWLLSLGGWPRTERRLARVVVELVRERIVTIRLTVGDFRSEDYFLPTALRELKLDPAKFQELKRRVEESG